MTAGTLIARLLPLAAASLLPFLLILPELHAAMVCRSDLVTPLSVSFLVSLLDAEF